MTETPNAAEAIERVQSFAAMFDDDVDLADAVETLTQLVVTTGELLDTELAMREGRSAGGALLEIIPDLAHIMGRRELLDDNDPDKEEA